MPDLLIVLAALGFLMLAAYRGCSVILCAPLAAIDTLPHNGAVITLLSVTGLSHRQSYGGGRRYILDGSQVARPGNQ
ncbi:MAG: hypothetical protein AB7G13_26680 [Lautropia sp.]